MMVLSLNLSEQSYDITVERGSLSKVGNIFNLDRKVLIVTDSGVPTEYANTVAKQCKAPVIATIPAGENSKCFEKFTELLSIMLNNGFTRKDCIVAVGGGVVGDLSGFAASTYMRGIDFYNIPTTLLSQVDSSIGGKTAIDFNGVKNIVGTFYQPKGVLVDTDTLKTLDKRQISCGLAEAVKMAATFDGELFSLIENSSNLENDIDEIIIRSLKIKRDVVEKDSKETGLRKVLNFGHTIGHAIESFENGRLLHGECVAIGMVLISSGLVKSRLVNVLKKYDLPVSTALSENDLLKFSVHDKKCENGLISAVFCNEIGSYDIKNVPVEKILENLEN